MDNSVSTGLEAIQGRTFILGREGHIYISDPSVSKEHAEIRLVDGRVHIRDLNSTNGIYLIKDNKPVRFQEGYVTPNQTVAIGTQQHTVRNLLSIVGIFAN
ncbi:MAG: FHA domain-containing protein [Gammaproteobacteria bacterium]|nr:FHA domain-containing protein [Gammaproteobacteria bacterium]MCP4981683.1 FHA domain-containing protein [Gammaproteobacteria bacterium]